MLRILLVEDSQLLTERLREEINVIPEVEIVGTADTEHRALALLREKTVDLLILDLQLRSGTGFGVLAKLVPPKPVVLVFTNYAIPAYARRALQLGADQVMDKSRDFERLIKVIEDVRKPPT